jgi:hypothetical protein
MDELRKLSGGSWTYGDNFRERKRKRFTFFFRRERKNKGDHNET